MEYTKQEAKKSGQSIRDGRKVSLFRRPSHSRPLEQWEEASRALERITEVRYSKEVVRTWPKEAPRSRLYPRTAKYERLKCAIADGGPSDVTIQRAVVAGHETDQWTMETRAGIISSWRVGRAL